MPATAVRAPFDLFVLRAQRLSDGGEDRAVVARNVLAIVAAFAGDTDTCEAAMAGHVSCAPGEPSALAAERQVRALAADAETRTLQLTGALPRSGDVLSGVLAGEYLLDDYLRIRAVEQHAAFGDDLTDTEDDARTARQAELAEQAREAAAYRAWARREDQRLCRCGRVYAEHRRAAGLEYRDWEYRGTGMCSTFTDVDQLPLTALPRDLLGAAIGSWAARHDVAVPGYGTADGVRLLEEIRAGDKDRDLRADAAFAAVAATLEWVGADRAAADDR